MNIDPFISTLLKKRESMKHYWSRKLFLGLRTHRVR